jgi:ABC-type oligopeptide transport system substrate-binding subunit
VPETDTAIGTASGWCQDFADAVTYFEPLFHSDSEVPAGSNYGRITDPQMDKLIEDAAVLEPGDERTAAWTEANRYATEQAFWVPRNWTKTGIIYAPSMVGEPKFGFFFNHIDWTAVGVDRSAA